MRLPCGGLLIFAFLFTIFLQLLSGPRPADLNGMSLHFGGKDTCDVVADKTPCPGAINCQDVEVFVKVLDPGETTENYFEGTGSMNCNTFQNIYGHWCTAMAAMNGTDYCFAPINFGGGGSD